MKFGLLGYLDLPGVKAGSCVERLRGQHRGGWSAAPSSGRAGDPGMDAQPELPGTDTHRLRPWISISPRPHTWGPTRALGKAGLHLGRGRSKSAPGFRFNEPAGQPLAPQVAGDAVADDIGSRRQDDEQGDLFKSHRRDPLAAAMEWVGRCPAQRANTSGAGAVACVSRR